MLQKVDAMLQREGPSEFSTVLLPKKPIKSKTLCQTCRKPMRFQPVYEILTAWIRFKVRTAKTAVIDPKPQAPARPMVLR
eukprot:s3901_g3.t1